MPANTPAELPASATPLDELVERLHVLANSEGGGPVADGLYEAADQLTVYARRVAELEGALQEIAGLRPFGDIDTARNTRALVQRMERMALDALARAALTGEKG